MQRSVVLAPLVPVSQYALSPIPASYSAPTLLSIILKVLLL